MKGCLRVRDKPSVYEVARLAGVSTATVSRVLAGYERVLPRTRDKVLTAVTELGYVPSGAARDLAARRTGVLGLCFPDLDSEDGDAAYWYDEVIRGMERAARRRGYAVLIAASHHRDDSGLVLSIAGRCDGLVVLARTAPQAMIDHVATRTPVVLLATEEGGGRPDRAIDHLAVANETGAYQVTAHLAARPAPADAAAADGGAARPARAQGQLRLRSVDHRKRQTQGGLTKEATDEQSPEILVVRHPGGRGRPAGPGHRPRGREPGQPVRRPVVVAAGEPARHRAGHLEVLRRGRRPGDQPADGQHHVRRGFGHPDRLRPVHLGRQHRGLPVGRGRGPGPRPGQRAAGPGQDPGHPHRGVAPEAGPRPPVPVVRHHQRQRADQSRPG